MSDYFEQVFRDEYLRTHCEKSDAELQAIVLTNAKKVIALPTNASASMLAEAKKWNIESKVCNEILADRKAKKQATESALKTWKDNAQTRVQELIINLPAAVSYTGQLIAAILEEEKLTADELAGWCDELAILEKEELDTILERLVAEQILAVNDGRYECINICTPSLYPENPVEWGMKKVEAAVAQNSNRVPERVMERSYLVLMALNLEDTPLTTEGLQKEISYYKFLVEEGKCDESDMNMDKYDLNELISFLTRAGVLEGQFMAGERAFYFKQLGKVLNKNKSVDKMIAKMEAEEDAENMTSVMKDNQEYKKVILRVLAESGSEMTVFDIQQSCDELSNLSNQRVSALVRQLVTANFVTRIEKERKAYFVFNNED